MRVIPVLDVRHGQAVRAVAGDRAHYGPLRSVLHEGTDPVTLARAGRETWHLHDLYLADLDAILGEATPDLALFRALAEIGLTLWVDAGVKDVGDVPPLLESGVAQVIVGLETVRGPAALAEIVAAAGPERVVFSLDLRDGRPMIEPSADWGTDRADPIVSRVISLGIRRVIHLDLARVGTGQNSDLMARDSPPDSLGTLAHNGLDWIIGGGITTPEQLAHLARIGAWGALIGSALHQGQLHRENLIT